MAIPSPHAALLCSPGMGHLIPALELAKCLVTHRIIPTLTFFLVSTQNNNAAPQAETQVLQSAIKENLFDIIQLPAPDISHLVGPDTHPGIKLATMMHQIAPLLLPTISTMKAKPTYFITDMFGSLTLPILEELKMSKYIFMTSNAWTVAFFSHFPTLDKQIQGHFRDQNKPIQIPGCKPVHPLDMFEPLLDRTNDLYHVILRTCQELTVADGVLVNTFLELEPETLSALSSGQITKVPIYPIGPLIRERKEIDEQRTKHVVDWLDKQHKESVVYVSFGSGYRMSYEQMKEMALGLELSGQKFVWSVRPPVTKANFDHYLTAGEDVRTDGVSKFEQSSCFPDELSRIQNNGIMVMDWAPQLDILRHSSVGGFVTHCGWNSVLESISCGVPMVGWPLYAEQRMNAALLAEEIKIAVRLEVPLSTDMVGREEIAKAIRKIMDKEDKEGCAMRKRVKELKHIAAESAGGSSLSKLASAFSNGVSRVK